MVYFCKNVSSEIEIQLFPLKVNCSIYLRDDFIYFYLDIRLHLVIILLLLLHYNRKSSSCNIIVRWILAQTIEMENGDGWKLALKYLLPI